MCQVCRSETTRPFAAICGADQNLRIDFEPGTNRISYIRQALDQVRPRIAESSSGTLPFYGQPTGVVVNYSPDEAVRFDVQGNALEVLPEASRPGQLTVSIGL